MSTRRRSQASGSAKRARKTLDLAADEDHIQSSDSEQEEEGLGREPSLSSEEEEEDAEVKRVRLAREYLQKVEARSDESSSEDDDDDEDEDVIGRRLQKARLQHEGTLERALAAKLQRHVHALQKSIADERPALLTPDQAAAQWIESGLVQSKRGHDLTPTCAALHGNLVLSGSKDHSVILWDLEADSKTVLCPHWRKSKTTTANKRSGGQVLAVALNDRYAAVGQQNGLVSIFDVKSREFLKEFSGHKGAVTALTFRSQSNQLFSASADRCIRHYNLDEMLYLETLYGHQFGITAIDCHMKERPVSVGQDRTVRAWKLAEDSHLIFRGGAKMQAAQAVSLIKDDWFVTGHQDGHLCLWMVEKKKAVATIENAHGEGNEVVSVAAIKGSDVVASGSNDGYLRLWKASTGKILSERGLEPLCQIPVRGYINDLCFEPKGKFCVAVVGQEHRCGRWGRSAGAKNRVLVINLQSASEAENDPESEGEQVQETAPAVEASSEEEQSDSE